MSVRYSQEWPFQTKGSRVFVMEAALTQPVLYYHHDKKIYGYHLTKGVHKELCDLTEMDYREIKLWCIEEDRSVYLCLIGASTRFYRVFHPDENTDWDLQPFDLQSLSKKDRIHLVNRNIVNDPDCCFDSDGFTYQGKTYIYDTPLRCRTYQWIRQIGTDYYIVLIDDRTGRRELWQTSTEKGSFFQKTKRRLLFVRELGADDPVVYCPLTATFYTLAVRTNEKNQEMYSIHGYAWNIPK